MQFTQAIASAILLFTATSLAAPVPQLAGEGAACNSLLSGTDNAVGYGIENAENNIAGNVKGARSTLLRMMARQLAGEGAACNSLLSGTDNAVGYGIEDAEDNIAATLGGKTTATSSGSSAAPPPKAPKGPKTSKRQLDKIANGAGAIGSAAGLSAATGPVVAVGDSLDGSLTSGAANLGASLADTEVTTLESIGKSVPKRQLDKIANGAGAIGKAAGLNAATDPVVAVGDSLDGSLTSGAANLGASLADTEVNALESIGKSVPRA